MAVTTSKSSSSKSNHHPMMMPTTTIEAALRSPILASCYSSNLSTTLLQSFHYSSTSEGGAFPVNFFPIASFHADFSPQGPSGVPEVPSGYPKSPPLASRRPSYSSVGLKEASRSIARECERLLCRDMKRIFLGAGGANSKNVSGLIGSINNRIINNTNRNRSFAEKGMEFIEVWDYVGEASFRGFIAEKQIGDGTEKTLFLFFQELAGLPLKEGLVALIELATDCYHCDRLVICLDRQTHTLHQLIRDLGWVGFELITLSHWIDDGRNPRNGREGTTNLSDTSEVWLFVGMDL